MDTSETSRASAIVFPEIDTLPILSEMPDPLVFRDGTPVASRDDWENARKPELMALFQNYMYGFAPAAPAIRAATVHSKDESFFDGAAIMKQISLAFGPEGAPPINLLLLAPKTPGDAPLPGVFLGLNFGGNHTVLADASIPLPEGAVEADRGKATLDWPIREMIARGYAVATFHSADIAPDRPDFTGGAFPFFDPPGEARPGDAWGVIAAWAWGLQRAVDYLITEDLVDADRILLYGFSRNGKAALLSAAFDGRVAAVIAHQAGCGGSGPSRCESPEAETVSIITKTFPCWFNQNFAKFGGREERLPFDQNGLVALCAPRPVLFTAGSRDRWANPAGQWDVLEGAHAAYDLYGIDSGTLGAPAEPPLETLIGGRLSYCLRDTAHAVDSKDWSIFADFADRQVRIRRSDRSL